MNLKNMTVLVTGAGGFVGSHLVERLIEHGCKVRCFVRYNSRGDVGLLNDLAGSTLASAEIVAGDLRDSDAIREAVKGVAAVFHLGASIAIPYSYKNPREVTETNILGTFNVMQAARDHGVEKVVHTSTSEVYGTAQYVPMDEKHPLQGQSPYSASKIGADKIVESFYNSYSLPVTTIRPFNIYGPRQSTRAVIPTIITQLLKGDDVRLGAITPTRDFTYVKDTVDAFMKIAESDNAVGGVFNAGSRFEVSIGELVERVAAIMGKEANIITDEKRIRPDKSEVQRLFSDSVLAEKTFGWKPEMGLDDGLRYVIDWMKQRVDRYRIGEYTL